MCGIAGIVSLEAGRPVDPSRVVRMRDTLVHRGPDDAGLWADAGVALGHRRLAIVDVAGGRQPLANEDESVWVVLNGELYNHLALRRDLEARGHRYRTRSDTETLVHLYEEHGDACVEKLRGMFAFALWDVRKRRLLLARDRLGIKPLYWAEASAELIFGSEIKALLAAGTLRGKLDPGILPEFLATRYVSGAGTFFQGVRKLLPGRTLTWSAAEGIRERRWWQPPTPPPESAEADLASEARSLREHLRDAVESHLMSDVPLGVFLSGGIDSTAIAALMASMRQEPIRTFSVGYDDERSSELSFARLAARAIGSEHREVVVSPDEFFRSLPRLVWHEDEPIAYPSSVCIYFVARLAREHVKVVLTGEGSDELFLGYNWYRLAAWNARLAPLYHALVPKPARAAVRAMVARLLPTIAHHAERTFLARDPDPRSLAWDNFAVFSRERQERLWRDPSLLAACDPYAEQMASFERAGGDFLARLSHADVETYLVELLMRQDQMSMAASIENRVPFLDHPLVEHAMGLPSHLKLHGFESKAVLRAAVRDLVPPAILTRAKRGFAAPIGRWMAGPCFEAVKDLVAGPRALGRGFFDPAELQRLLSEHASGARAHTERLWLLAGFELWQRVFLDGETP
jgi:asparagine synthase (glutamine-hydrolysing)